MKPAQYGKGVRKIEGPRPPKALNAVEVEAYRNLQRLLVREKEIARDSDHRYSKSSQGARDRAIADARAVLDEVMTDGVDDA